MIVNKQVSSLLIGSSLLIAILLVILPLPPWALLYWPNFLVITVLFWVLMQPLSFGLGMAWCCGLLIDVLHGTPLGQHGLAMAVAAYLVLKLREILWFSVYWQQALFLLPVFGIHEFVLFWIDGVIGHDIEPLHRWLPVCTNTVIWPACALCLERFAERDVRY